MKKIAITSLIALFAAGSANAGVFDINYRPTAGHVNGQFGVAFTSGLNETADNQTDLTAGETGVTGVKLAYGVSDTFALTFEAGANDYNNSGLTNLITANPEVGINWQALGDKALSLDVIAKYGIAWTENAITDTRIGQNNLQAGLRLYGASGDFQWGVKALGKYVFIEGGDIWVADLSAEAMYYFDPSWALALEVNYSFLDVSEDPLYNRSVALGVVYNISQSAAVKPYVAYHFETTDDDSFDYGDAFFQIGAKFSVQF